MEQKGSVRCSTSRDVNCLVRARRSSVVTKSIDDIDNIIEKNDIHNVIDKNSGSRRHRCHPPLYSTKTTAKGVRRCLFGPIDHEEARADLAAMRRQQGERDRTVWGFDFQTCRPVDGEGRYEWTSMAGDENAWQDHHLASRTTIMAIGTGNRNPLREAPPAVQSSVRITNCGGLIETTGDVKGCCRQPEYVSTGNVASAVASQLLPTLCGVLSSTCSAFNAVDSRRDDDVNRLRDDVKILRQDATPTTSIFHTNLVTPGNDTATVSSPSSIPEGVKFDDEDCGSRGVSGLNASLDVTIRRCSASDRCCRKRLASERTIPDFFSISKRARGLEERVSAKRGSPSGGKELTTGGAEKTCCGRN